MPVPTGVEAPSRETEKLLVGEEQTTAGRVRSVFSRVRRPPRRLRIWRVSAVLAALCLALLIAAGAPGSLTVIKYAPIEGTKGAAHMPWWEATCSRTAPAPTDTELAFCARVRGRVIATGIKGNERDLHVLVTGGFHVVLVELNSGTKSPSLGSFITAVGPLSTASMGFHELHAVWLRSGW